MRTLVYVPVVHTQADMGTLAPAIQSIAVEMVGGKRWNDSLVALDELWEVVYQEILCLSIDFSSARIYQDALPICGKELNIVADLAAKGSPNHRLVLDLVNKGAKLMGTESPDLLLEEYKFARSILGAGGAGPATQMAKMHQDSSKLILDRRDAFIAKRIGETLYPGETGILFLGLLHSVVPRLPSDIRVQSPFSSRTRAGKPDPAGPEGGESSDPRTADSTCRR